MITSMRISSQAVHLGSRVLVRQQDYPMSTRERTDAVATRTIQDLDSALETNRRLIDQTRESYGVIRDRDRLLNESMVTAQAVQGTNQELLRTARETARENRILYGGIVGGASGIGAALLLGLSGPRMAITTLVAMILGAFIGNITDKKNN